MNPASNGVPQFKQPHAAVGSYPFRLPFAQRTALARRAMPPHWRRRRSCGGLAVTRILALPPRFRLPEAHLEARPVCQSIFREKRDKLPRSRPQA